MAKKKRKRKKDCALHDVGSWEAHEKLAFILIWLNRVLVALPGRLMQCYSTLCIVPDLQHIRQCVYLAKPPANITVLIFSLTQSACVARFSPAQIALLPV